MSDVSFNEPQYDSPHALPPKKTSILTRAMMASGLAKDDASAQRNMLYLAIGAAVLAIAIYFVWGK